MRQMMILGVLCSVFLFPAQAFPDGPVSVGSTATNSYWTSGAWAAGGQVAASEKERAVADVLGDLGVGRAGVSILSALLTGIKVSREDCMSLDKALRHSLCVAVSGKLKTGITRAESELFGKFYYKYSIADDTPGKHIFDDLTVGPQLTTNGRANLTGVHGDAQAMFGISAH